MIGIKGKINSFKINQAQAISTTTSSCFVSKDVILSNSSNFESLNLMIEGLLGSGNTSVVEQSYAKCPLNRIVDYAVYQQRKNDLVDNVLEQFLCVY